MKKLCLLFLAAIVLFSCTSEEETLQYVIQPTEFNGNQGLEVTLSFTPSDSTATILLFQDRGWGQENLHNLVHNLQIIEGADEIVQEKEKDHYVISHDPASEKIVITYTLLQDTNGDLDTEKAVRPIINQEYFHIYSHNFFMLPKSVIDRTEDAFNVSITWNGFSEGYALQNSFLYSGHFGVMLSTKVYFKKFAVHYFSK